MGRQAPSEVSLSKAALLRAESQQEGLVAEPLASLRVESNHQALRLDNGRVLPVDLREHRLEDILWDQVLAEEVELVLAQHAVDVPADLGRFEEVVHGVAEARAVLDVHVAIHLVVAHGEVDVRLPPVRGLQLENERLLGGGGVLREDHIRLEREHVACRLAPVRQASCLARDHLWWPVHHPTEHTELVALANIHGLALHGLDCVDDIDLERDGEDGVDESRCLLAVEVVPHPLGRPHPLSRLRSPALRVRVRQSLDGKRGSHHCHLLGLLRAACEHRAASWQSRWKGGRAGLGLGRRARRGEERGWVRASGGARV
mmetsp:Transcript_16116/g.41066  ORF Transcript_16116/g.41066 Transcript_16116/m.41066 type:complete len:316 (-) Transcript_16116:54-1001(-)